MNFQSKLEANLIESSRVLFAHKKISLGPFGALEKAVTCYPIAGAMRINSTPYYVLKDPLGSASVVINASGTTA